MAELIIRRGPDSGKFVSIDDELVIGRSSRGREGDKHFCRLSDAEISRRHLRIFRQNGAYFIEDLNSTNGTLLHGQFLQPGTPTPLVDGDELYLGNSQAVFRLLSARQQEGAPGGDARENQQKSPAGGHQVHVFSDEDRPPDVSMVVDASQILMQLRERIPSDHEINRDLVKRMQAMVQVSIALGAITKLDDLLAKIMTLIFDIFSGAERAFVFACSKDTEQFVPLIVRNRNEDETPDIDKIGVSRTIIKEVLQKKNALLLMDAQGDKRFGVQDSVMDLAIRSVMCAPLLYEGEVLGLVQVDTRKASNIFSPEDLEILTGISAQMAISMKNSQLYEEIERVFEGFVRASVQAIEARDPSTAGHSFRVADYTEKLAIAVDRAGEAGLRDVRFNREQMQEIRYAALLHDFGKVGVREHILTKAKKLYPYELRELQLRIKYAKTTLENKAYRELLELYQANTLSAEEFRLHRQKVEAGLQQEITRLNEFLTMIIEANEPEYHYDKNKGRLDEAKNYQFYDREQQRIQLLTDFEFSALSFSQGSLNPEERSEIESHVSHTFEFLSLIPWTGKFAGIPNIAHAHHEKLDGTGYPKGLVAEQIPLQSRIMTIADIYDALTAGDRPYRRGTTSENALSIIEGEVKEGKLDQQLFRIFVESESYKI